MWHRASVIVALCCVLLGGNLGLNAAGPKGSSVRQQPNEEQFGQRAPDPKVDPEVEKKMAKQRMKDRYKDLSRDSEKLLELATELKQQVDKSGENVLSMDVVKKCEEIEKLAKSVRTKMRGD